MQEQEGEKALSCLLSSIMTEAQADKAISLTVKDICADFIAKKTENTPGILKWLDPLGISEQGASEAADFKNKLSLNVDFVNNRSNVDLCDTHLHQNSAVQLYCLLMGIRDPATNVNALSATMCPQVVADLKAAELACKDVPDTPSAGGTASMKGKESSQRAECQVLHANGAKNAKLTDRVKINTAAQLVKHQEFMKLLPHNYTSLSVLVGRMSTGVFSPEKEALRVGEVAKPKDFSATNNPTPAGTTLQFSAGKCVGGNKRMELEFIGKGAAIEGSKGLY
jgi:hypothetical protein